jgi:mannitol-1-phosphate 5-dehydrogenase
MATAVGVNILPFIAKNISAGLDLRGNTSGNPLDIIVCENMSDGGKHLKNLVLEGSSNKEYIEENVGFVSASVGRMVPVSESTGIVVEAYNELPVDKDALKTDISGIYNIVPVSPFAIEKYKKYFMHNMSHAIVAYLGFIKGYEYIWQAISDDYIKNISELALKESIQAITKYFGKDEKELSLYASDLLKRYENKYLGDTILRVGRDPVRKLGKDDRLVGAAYFCMENDIIPEHILYGIAAALYFNVSDDISAPNLDEFIKKNGAAEALSKFSEIHKDSYLLERILLIHRKLSQL